MGYPIRHLTVSELIELVEDISRVRTKGKASAGSKSIEACSQA